MLHKKAIKLVAVTLTIIMTFLLVGSTWISSFDRTYNPWITWNGYKIYLSRAHATGGGGTGCDGFVERYGSRDLANHATYGYDPNNWNLLERGYMVRIGDGNYIDNVKNSNSWGAHYHIPLHSNGIGGLPENCATTNDLNYSASGTIVMYYSTSTHGKGMSESFRVRVGVYGSPGKGKDVKYYNNNLYEIYATKAYAVYLESAFHTFRPDKNWLQNEESWSWRIGYSIDAYLGYPRR